MQDLIKSKIIISFSFFGIAFTFLLSLLSGSSIAMVFIKSILGGLILGGVGAALDFFLKKSLSPEDYDRLIQFGGKMENSINSEHRLDVVDETPEDSIKSYQELYQHNEEDNIPSGELGKVSSDIASDGVITEPPVESDSHPEEERNLSPDSAFHEQFKEQDFSSIPKVSFPDERVSSKEISYSEETSRNDTIKEGKFKKASKEEGVTFKLKNRVITADPGLVAKAIKTILHKEQ